jgi:hypothetical protein
MKTITVNLYKFSELSEDAKEKAINYFRESNNNDQPWFIDDANNTFESFAKLFSINWQSIDYEQPYRNEYSIKLDDQIIQLSGQRLATYIWNNYKRDLFKGKYYHSQSFSKINHPVKHKRVKSQTFKSGNVFNAYYSAIQLEHSCVLTGVCYDEDILQPIYDFLDKPTDIDFETLLNDCIYSLCHSISSEIEYQQSDEAITEDIEVNDYDFDINGNLS